MSSKHPRNRLFVEAGCLALALVPMIDDDPAARFRKIAATGLLAVWSILVLDLTAAQPEPWLMYAFTGFVFLLVGRMWDIKLEEVDLTNLIGGGKD